MPLNITARVEDGIALIDLSGPLTLGPSLVEVRNNAKQLLEAHKLNGIIVDVGAVTKTDTSGLAELTTVYMLAAKRQCPLRLVEVKPELRKILTLTHLDGLMPTAKDVASAKNELKKPRANSSSA